MAARPGPNEGPHGGAEAPGLCRRGEVATIHAHCGRRRKQVAEVARVILSRSALDASADPKWALVDAVYDFLARTDRRDLSPVQQVAQLALFYDNEVNNGGHLQYFHNVGIGEAEALIRALDAVGAACQREIFERALALARENPVEQADSLEDYSERAYEREFWDHDTAYYKCRPELGNELLADYVQANVAEFVDFE